MGYKNLFPFEKVQQGSRVVIYGAGAMGIEYLQQILITKYVQIVCFVDRNYEKYVGFPIPVYPKEKLKQLDFDYVVLAFQTNTYEKIIVEFLLSIGVERDRIIGVFSRPEAIIPIAFRKDCVEEFKEKLSFVSSEISVAVKLSGALGDNIIRKKVIEALVKIAPDCQIDLYSPVANSLLKSLYSNVTQVKNFIDDGGLLYSNNSEKYTIAMTIANFIRVDSEKLESIEEKNVFFYRKMKLLIERCKEYRVDFSMPLYTFFSRAIKRGKNCYTVYDYDGVFDISDKDAHIKLNKDYRNSFANLNVNKYITINYGNAVSKNVKNQIAKQWPLDYFEKLILLLKKQYPNYEIVQLGGADAVSVKGTDRIFLGQNFEVVKYILAYSKLHIDIEGGLVHLATQLGTKCVVLFGPTQKDYFGYDENINIKRGRCHDCYGMCMDINRCVRDMDKPECMYSITPKMVFKEVTNYLETIL